MLVKCMVMFLETMLQDVRDEAFKQGFAEGQFLRKLEALKRLMKKMNMTLEEALDFSDIPEDERSRYVSALQKDSQ